MKIGSALNALKTKRCRQVRPKTKTKMTYSSSVAMSRRSYARKNQNAVAYRAQTKALGPVSNTVILIVLACIVGLLYLTQVTKTNSFGYTINSLQQQQSQLQDEKSNLEVAAARLQSLDRVSKSQVAKNMLPANQTAVIQQ
jgi:hypothetical protein